MLNVPAFAAEKNKLSGAPFVMLFELEIEDGNFVRFARWDTTIIFEDQAWEAFGFGDGVEISQNSQGEIPVYDIAFTNIGRSIQSILEFYVVENREGRIVWVHPQHLSDPTAKVEEKFVVVSARADLHSATLTVSAAKFDPLGVQIPSAVVSIEEFPGVIGNASRFVV